MRSRLWLAALILFAIAFVIGFVVLPMRAPAPEGGPAVEVPRMENVPSPNAPRMQLEVLPKEAVPSDAPPAAPAEPGPSP